MALLSRKNLDLQALHYLTNWKEFESGKKLYESGKARITSFEMDTAICEVAEKGQIELVQIEAASSYVKFSCSCIPQTPLMCRHAVAAAHTLRDYLKDVAEKDWRYRIERAFSEAPRPSRTAAQSKTLQPAVVFVGLQINKVHNSPFYSAVLHPYFVSAERSEAVNEIAKSSDPAQAARTWLAQPNDWYALTEPYLPGTPIQPVNLSFEANSLLQISISSLYSYQDYLDYYGQKHLKMPYSFRIKASLPLERLLLLGHLGIPVLLEKETTFSPLLRIYEQPVALQALFSEETMNYKLEAGLQVEDMTYTLNRNLKIISETPPIWALAGETLVQISNPHALSVLSLFPLVIPRQDAEEFRKTYFKRITQHLPVIGEIVHWEVVQAQPVPRLYLTQKGDAPLEAELRFGYGEHEFPSRGSKPVSEEIIELPGQWGGIRVLRDEAAERHYHDLLADPRYGLKRAGADRPSIFQLRARTHPLDFLMKSIPALIEAGFEIYGDKDIAKINRHKPILSLNISSGIDWFDVQAVVQYGDQQVNLNEIRRALKRGERYIKLADGSVGQIPEEWLEKYKHLFNLAEETADGLRISDLQLPLLDELLAEAETKNIAPEFHAKRERLKSFEHIAEQPLPQGFIGELRPYQKAGYDWLHFLHEYGFGGILADDMGLGKTIQALAFLQSLKERGLLTRPALLVVPKSLLVNWQREAERFTPQLRVLEFMGQSRKKDPAHFEHCDIVITTYGTMLRDIEFLRQYRFSYVILDESQAIKNPLSQSSKAVRLLQADHRLCLTGTPVENNVYELWSQFAFLNPGLLGSLEYFKSEFANIIERREEASQSTTQLLRKLTYPFILRRTKEQVAPELPPRTERIIFTDLEPAQRKLYQQTRDYYRGLLMGMLEEGSEINDIRFKILEGLLRMRQVCIHPQLVEPTYHGGSAKFEALLETLETLQAEGHKALVFSQFVQALTLLRKEMEARNMPYAYLDGQTENRQEQVDRFQNDPSVPFFLISLKAGGVGLNLTAADYVLHLDPWWNPAVEMQAADRAHRIGQDKPVFIYKFIARETVEEKILQLQQRKRELVEQLISAEAGFFKSLTKEDVEVLFS